MDKATTFSCPQKKCRGKVTASLKHGFDEWPCLDLVDKLLKWDQEAGGR